MIMKVIVSFLFFSCCLSLEALFNTKEVVLVEAFWLPNQNHIQLNLFLTEGYGIQKGSLHQIDLYSVIEGHQKEKNFRDKIKNFGRLVQVKKRLSGITAAENKKYLSFLNPLLFKKIKKPNEDYIIQGKLFYCSFRDAFCSIQNFEEWLPRMGKKK